jgi:tetratricopeptide (TPR) repeat protein
MPRHARGEKPVTERRDCSEEQVKAFVAGTLSRRDRSAVAEHLVSCGVCRLALDVLRDDDASIDRTRFTPGQVADELREAQTKLRDAEEDGVKLLPSLLSESSELWRRIVATDDRFRTAGVVRAIVTLADEYYRPLITRAVELYALAVDVAEMLRGSEQTDRVATMALRKWGVALTARGDCREGLRAINLAESHVGTWPDADAEIAALNVARAFPLRILGRHAEAREQLLQAKEIAARFGLNELLANAIYAEAGIAYQTKSYPDARRLYELAAKQMRLLGERQMEAGAENSIGHCFAHEGNAPGAIEHWAKAKTLFVRCGMHGDTVRISVGVARMKISNGEIEEGLDILRESVDEFTALAMSRDAIDASLEVVESLVLYGYEWDEVVNRCATLLPLAQTAGLAEQASVAIAYLRRAATEHSVDADYVRHVRQFISDSRAYPAAQFQPPIAFRG